MQFFEFESQPNTAPDGALDPPRRRPPTAIGIDKLPPRGPDDPSDSAADMHDDGARARTMRDLRAMDGDDRGGESHLRSA